MLIRAFTQQAKHVRGLRRAVAPPLRWSCIESLFGRQPGALAHAAAAQTRTGTLTVFTHTNRSANAHWHSNRPHARQPPCSSREQERRGPRALVAGGVDAHGLHGGQPAGARAPGVRVSGHARSPTSGAWAGSRRGRTRRARPAQPPSDLPTMHGKTWVKGDLGQGGPGSRGRAHLGQDLGQGGPGSRGT